MLTITVSRQIFVNILCLFKYIITYSIDNISLCIVCKKPALDTDLSFGTFIIVPHYWNYFFPHFDRLSRLIRKYSLVERLVQYKRILCFFLVTSFNRLFSLIEKDPLVELFVQQKCFFLILTQIGCSRTILVFKKIITSQPFLYGIYLWKQVMNEEYTKMCNSTLQFDTEILLIIV